MTFLFKMAGFSLKNPSKCNSALSCCTSLVHLSSAVVFGLAGMVLMMMKKLKDANQR
jgi:hypothetical protein